jgi:hypothetical protein
MINPYDREAVVLAAKIIEAEPDLQFHRLHVMLADFAEVVRREADTAAVQRMSRPLGALAQRIEHAEARLARVRMHDSADGLLAMDLAWACEELRKTDAARAAPPPPPPGRTHEAFKAPIVAWMRERLRAELLEAVDDWTTLGATPAERARRLVDLRVVAEGVDELPLFSHLDAFVRGHEMALAEGAR